LITDGYGLAIPSVPEPGIRIEFKLEKVVAWTPRFRRSRSTNAPTKEKNTAFDLLISLPLPTSRPVRLNFWDNRYYSLDIIRGSKWNAIPLREATGKHCEFPTAINPEANS
jgi:hypothetical protein